MLEKIFNMTDKGFIFIIDEWDCVFRMAKERSDIQKNYLDFLRGLFKGADYVELAYMTGILPIKKYGEHSAINIFSEYSMVDPKNLGPYFGFTEKEAQMQCSLKVYIDLNFDGLKEAVTAMLGNGRCRIDPGTFQNDMTTFKTRDDVLAYLSDNGFVEADKDDPINPSLSYYSSEVNEYADTSHYYSKGAQYIIIYRVLKIHETDQEIRDPRYGLSFHSGARLNLVGRIWIEFNPDGTVKVCTVDSPSLQAILGEETETTIWG